MNPKTSEAETLQANGPPESGPDPAAANDNQSRSLAFKELELPEHHNRYQWTIGAISDGLTVGIGKHHLKSEAKRLAEEAAKHELGRRAVTEQLKKSGLFEKHDTHPQGPPTDRRPLSRKKRESAIMRLRQTIRELSDERGKRAEELVFQAFEGPASDSPAWFKGVRRPTPEQDAFQQIDVIVETHDMGELYVQVKSSFTGLKRFMDEYHPANVRCIVVTPNLDDVYIRALVYDACNRLRDKRRRGEI